MKMIFFIFVTELVLMGVPNLRLRTFCLGADESDEAVCLENYQVNVKKGGRQVRSNKYSDLQIGLGRQIEIRIYEGERFSGVVLTPSQFSNHARLVFSKRSESGGLLVTGIAIENVKRCLVNCRGFGTLFFRDAYYDRLGTTVIGGSSDEVDSASAVLKDEVDSASAVLKDEASFAKSIQRRICEIKGHLPFRLGYTTLPSGGLSLRRCSVTP